MRRVAQNADGLMRQKLGACTAADVGASLWGWGGGGNVGRGVAQVQVGKCVPVEGGVCPASWWPCSDNPKPLDLDPDLDPGRDPKTFYLVKRQTFSLGSADP